MVRARRELAIGDNLDALSRLADESISLAYLDPPFNSGRGYDLVDANRAGSKGDGRTLAFDDQWKWTSDTQAELRALPSIVPSGLAELVQALVAALGRRDLTAYLVRMAPRLVELRRVLDGRGSLYLHCDTSASHYLRVLLDEVFGAANFRNEIVWRRTHAHSSSRRYGPVHDILLFYTKSQQYRWNPVYTAYPTRYLDQYYTQEDENGRYQLITCTAPGDRAGTKAHYEWRGRLPPPGRHWAWKKEQMQAFERDGRLAYSSNGTPRLKRYADEAPGVQLQDVWTDINRLDAHAEERIGFETQKPLTLMARIIEASSDPGDVVLDPFAGSGSTLVAAERAGRGWVGIDSSLLAGSISLARVRQEVNVRKVQLVGFPADAAEARRLRATEPLAFGLWATSLLATLAQRADRTPSLITGSGRLRIKRRLVQLLSWAPLRNVARAKSSPSMDRGRLSKAGFVVLTNRDNAALASHLRERLEIPIHDVPIETLVTAETRQQGIADQVLALTPA